ncbi:Nitrous oxide-stimulated promoter [Klebsiella pneumoniae]|uniref:Nitrous oxide-stimulated promoter n=1 Tax=Klebsiella pneumoniae TaxID=573 RepID=A0A377TYV6_KLEPN|nr:Nitrous oxide-stimulated promoter [Klebsiella pneumoniae]
MDIKVYDKCILKKTKGGEMGKRIEREKMTIQRMIALYQRRCPEAQADNAHYQALNAYADKRLDKCVVWREQTGLQAVSGALLPAGEARGDEADYALGRAADALAPPDPHYSPSAGRQAPGAAAAGKISTEKVAAFPGQRCAAGRQVVLL